MKIYFTILTLLCTVLTITLPGATGVGLEKTVSLAPRPEGKVLGIWNGNALVLVENGQSEAPRIRVYKSDGTLGTTIGFRIPGARLINIYNGRFTRCGDGMIAVAGSAYDGNSQGAAFLAILSPDGARQTVIRTSPYVATTLAFSSDGVLWTAGRELVDGKEGPPNHPIIRRFGRDGKLLSSAMPRDGFSTARHPVIASSLVASSDRVGWYSELAQVYIEFSLDGREFARYRTDGRQASGIAICPDNTLVVNAFNDQPAREWEFLSLDRQAGRWRTVSKQPTAVYLHGCTAESSLVTTTSDPGLLELRSIAQK